MKTLIIAVVVCIIAMSIIKVVDNSIANQYAQMIRKCELTLTEGGKCQLLAVPVVTR
jgi:hypothetical protein